MQLQRKKSSTAATAPQGALANSLFRGLNSALGNTLNRRSFLKRSGVGVGVGAAAAGLAFEGVEKAQAQAVTSKVEVKRTVCTHCSVGCAVDAVVENGVWVRQEPVFDSPINLGAHCAKGYTVRECGRLGEEAGALLGPFLRLDYDFHEVAAVSLADADNSP